ncbi:MAG TPA: response regulator [Candidatus Thermoplasmatota archaeon]|nr:response regulator [Candidatus Thermoplasmatota archaeon]
MSILIVDDDELMTELLPRKLRSAVLPAPRILTARTPEEGIRVAEDECPSVVLSDYNLRATMNGLDVLAAVGRSCPDAVRILFSGHARHEIGPRLEGAGLDGFLEKPLRLDELIPPFLEILNRSGVHAEPHGPAS